MRRRFDSTLEAFPNNPIIQKGDLIRLRGPMLWCVRPSGEIRVPAGTTGRIEEFKTHDWGLGLAVRFDGIAHPQFEVFPKALCVAGRSHYSDNYELIARKK